MVTGAVCIAAGISILHFGGKNGVGNGPEGSKRCFIRVRPDIPVTAGKATREYLLISQNRF